MELREWLKKNDVNLYASKARKSDARKQYQEETGVKVSAKAFSEAIPDCCEFWKQVHRKRLHPSGMLSVKQWENVKRQVEDLLPIISGQSIDFAVEVVRSRVSCSRSVLNGLPSRLRAWN